MIAKQAESGEPDRKKSFYSDPSAKPTVLTTDPAGIPAQLKGACRWVAWELKWNAKKGVWDKLPLSPWGRGNAKANVPETWGTFDAALAALAKHPDLAGLGYEFEKGAGEFGVDLDDCRDPNTGAIAPWAQEIIDLFNTYVEVSPSGTGVKLIGRGKLPYCRKLSDREAYDHGRFFTTTGRPVPGSPAGLTECQAAIDAHFTRLFPPLAKKPVTPRTEAVGNTSAGEPDDDALIEKIRASGQGEKFAALYDRGDTSGHEKDDSRADLALCCILAWWTRKDAGRIDRLFRRSKLFRGKWDERRGEGQTYGSLTVSEAIALTEGEYDPNHNINVIIRGFAGEAHAAPAGPNPPTPEAPIEQAGSATPNAPEAGDDSAAPGSGGDSVPPGDDEPGDEADGGDAKADTKKSDEKEKGKPAATRVVELAREAGVCLFHTPDDEAYAQVPRDDHVEVHAVKGSKFGRFLAQLYFEAEGKALNGEAMTTAVNTLAAMAAFRCPEHPVYRRVAPGPGGSIVLDLCDDRWRAVVIHPGRWEVTDRPPVMFGRASGMRPLPEPVRGGKLTELCAFLNLRSDDDWLLVAAWLAAAVRPTGPYPVLHPKGEQGTAKTTFAKMLRRLFDPNKVDLRSQPREERDLAVSSRHGWALCYDNLSAIPLWLSDALCRVATGGGFGTRALYTDDEEATFDFTRPVLVTSIEEVIGQPDLFDRSLPLELSPIPDEARKTEAELWAAFDAARPRILGGLLDVVAQALALLPGVTAEKLPVPRMADFALFGEAVARALGESPGRFLAILARTRSGADQDTLQGSPLSLALYELVRMRGTISGTYTVLLRELNGCTEFNGRTPQGWPASPRALSGQVRRLSPALRRCGVSVQHDREGHANTRVVTLRFHSEQVGGIPSAPSAPPADLFCNSGSGADGRTR